MRAMSEINGLAELAALSRGLSPERRRELDKQLPFDGSPRVNKGIVLGLAQVAETLAARSPESAKELRELAAVGAARVLHEEKEFRRVCAQWETPEARAQLEAEAKLFESGQMELVSADEVIEEMNR